MKYEIKGQPMPVVICYLEQNESVKCESGAMSWMTPNMEMQTQGGGAMKMLGKMFTAENLFQNVYTPKNGEGMIAFAAKFPGEIRSLEITPDSPIVVQKGGFLASDSGVELSVFFNKKAMTGFFGGEGFIMQKLSGHGTAFVELDGSIVDYELNPGEQLVVDTGYVAMMDASCKMEIVSVKGLKNKFLGGEGLFNTVVTGPGRVWLQTMPIVNFAGSIAGLLSNGN